jgi:hypothetical protein
MKQSYITGLQNSGTITQLQQVLSHLRIASPTEGDPMCHSCGEPIREGDSVTLHLSQPVGRSGYTVGQCRCLNHNDDLTKIFRLGTRELIVDGRIGLCRDYATQQTWPVLLAPSVRLVSAADTMTGRVTINKKESDRTNSKSDPLIQQPDINEISSERTALTRKKATRSVGGCV